MVAVGGYLIYEYILYIYTHTSIFFDDHPGGNNDIALFICICIVFFRFIDWLLLAFVVLGRTKSLDIWFSCIYYDPPTIALHPYDI